MGNCLNSKSEVNDSDEDDEKPAWFDDPNRFQAVSADAAAIERAAKRASDRYIQ